MFVLLFWRDGYLLSSSFNRQTFSQTDILLKCCCIHFSRNSPIMEAGGMILGHRAPSGAGIYCRHALIFREICHNMSSVTSFHNHRHFSWPTGSSCQTQRNTRCVILELHRLRLHNDLGWKSHSWTSWSWDTEINFVVFTERVHNPNTQTTESSLPIKLREEIYW